MIDEENLKWFFSSFVVSRKLRTFAKNHRNESFCSRPSI